MPSPLTSRTTVAVGPEPALSRGPGVNVQSWPRALPEEDRDVVGALVGDDQVGEAVAVDVGDGDADGVGPDGEGRWDLVVLAVAESEVDQDVVAAAVGDDQVGDAVAVEVRQHHGAGVQDALRAIAQDLRRRGDAGLDRDAVLALVGEGENVWPVRPEVGHRQGDLLVDVAGREAPLTVAQEHEHVAVAVADEQVGEAVAVDVGDGQAGRVGADIVGLCPGLVEPALAVAEVDGHAVGPEHGQVADAVAVEIPGPDDGGPCVREEGPGVGEGTAAQAGEDRERVRAGIDGREAGRPAPRERPERHPRRRLQRRQLGRAGGGDLQPIRSGPGGIHGGGAEGAVAVAGQDADIAGDLVGHDEIEAPRPAEVGQGDVRGAQAEGHVGLPDEAPIAVAEVDRCGPVPRVADDQVDVPIPIEVARDDLRDGRCERLTGRIVPAVARARAPDELAAPVRVQRDRVVPEIDAGEQRTLTGRDEGDVARGDAGVDRDGGPKLPGA